MEVEDRQSNFGLFTGQLELAGQNGNSRALYNAYKKDFQPRIGFAYTPNILSKKLVVRGAYTISSFLEGTGTNLRLPLNPPFDSEYQTLYNTPATFCPAATLDQGLSGLNNPRSVRGRDHPAVGSLRPSGEVQQWNLTTEFQLPGGATCSRSAMSASTART